MNHKSSFGKVVKTVRGNKVSPYVYYKGTKKCFDWAGFARGTEATIQTVVKESFGKRILLSLEEIEAVLSIFPCKLSNKGILADFNDVLEHPWIVKNQAALEACHKEALDCGYGFLSLGDKSVMELLIQIDMSSEARGEHYRTAKHFVEWFGIERARMRLHKDYIPQDDRGGYYNDDEYDGSKGSEFVSDNIWLMNEADEIVEEDIIAQFTDSSGYIVEEGGTYFAETPNQFICEAV